YQMNGVELPPEHGYPVRAIIPGWYGMDSVKWLVEVEALDHEDTSYFMTDKYVAVRLRAIGADFRSLTGMHIKSQIARPQGGEVLPLKPYLIKGAAWAGERRVATVEVSINAGKDWATAAFETKADPYTWVLWSYRWVPKAHGKYTI